jgi:hypothetical protein
MLLMKTISLNITITILDIINPSVFYLKVSVSETGLCSILQVELTQFGPIDRARVRRQKPSLSIGSK